MARTLKQMEADIETARRNAENPALSKYQRAMAYGDLKRLSRQYVTRKGRSNGKDRP